MRVVVVGGGGREYALVWRLKLSASVTGMLLRKRCDYAFGDLP